ncbi:glycoside hydrolase family 5 protein [Leeuwenhoekiella parthenopeia]|uniref:Glycoside hydrolase family 5 protein n=1 Tax=Leeuwenhoekiella parthenopeia TaxID=2890320 RepID=A0ABS8GX84_9FLAO|nr:cellulase family glycosylhydrolase [Leeuwenhoekiella parthenopeia]MCC4214421.1 glycoside hydrolase family 5 protein [Leeuwenhoekiella parthenopeia]
MTSINWKIFLSFIFISCRIFTTHSQGVNITGLEKTWKSEQITAYQRLFNDLQLLSQEGINNIRLPVDLNFFFENANENELKEFKKWIKRITRYASKHKMALILSNFNHHLSQENYKSQGKLISKNWLQLLDFLNDKHLLYPELYIDIVNEPVLYPKEWEETAKNIITSIRTSHPEVIIVCGASNYNSIYELSRMQPLPFKSIIYSFHFYEPFIFTHQGTTWTGNQNATTGIPFPYPDSTEVIQMPQLSEKAMGTEGAINYRDYSQTGTYQAIRDKLSLLNTWRSTYGVEVWCTEYGVTQNADKQSRIKYLKAVDEVLKELSIPGYIWEYKGNFGIDDISILQFDN